MKKIVWALPLLILFACNNKTEEKAFPIVGRWETQTLQSKGMNYDIKQRDSIMQVFMEDSRKAFKGVNGEFSETDSLNAVEENTALLDMIFSLNYEMKPDSVLLINYKPETSREWTTKKGVYSFNKATQEITLKTPADSLSPVKELVLKATIDNDVLTFVHADSTKQTFIRMKE